MAILIRLCSLHILRKPDTNNHFTVGDTEGPQEYPFRTMGTFGPDLSESASSGSKRIILDPAIVFFAKSVPSAVKNPEAVNKQISLQGNFAKTGYQFIRFGFSMLSNPLRMKKTGCDEPVAG